MVGAMPVVTQRRPGGGEAGSNIPLVAKPERAVPPIPILPADWITIFHCRNSALSSLVLFAADSLPLPSWRATEKLPSVFDPRTAESPRMFSSVL